MTEVVPSPTSSSWVRAISIMDLAAGCSTVISRRMALPSFVITIPPIGSINIYKRGKKRREGLLSHHNHRGTAEAVTFTHIKRPQFHWLKETVAVTDTAIWGGGVFLTSKNRVFLDFWTQNLLTQASSCIIVSHIVSHTLCVWRLTEWSVHYHCSCTSICAYKHILEKNRLLQIKCGEKQKSFDKRIIFLSELSTGSLQNASSSSGQKNLDVVSSDQCFIRYVMH